MNKLYEVAVVGGHGLVATRIVEDLEKSGIPIKNIIVYGSPQNKLRPLVINGKNYEIRTIDINNIPHFDFVFFSGSDDLANLYAKHFINQGAKVIDNSSFFRMREDIPLVIPEINSYDLLNQSMIYANPNCSTIMMLLALFPLEEYFKLERINVVTYQSASGIGKKALENFYLEMDNEFHCSKSFPHSSVVLKPLADNILPVIGALKSSHDYTQEEQKMRQESQKILHNPDLEVNATCVRVPTSIGHAAAIQAVFKEKLDLEIVNKLLQECPFLKVCLDDDYPDLLGVRNTHEVHVGRIRIDEDCEYTLNLFVTSDNLRRGASYNAVSIAKRLLELGVI